MEEEQVEPKTDLPLKMKPVLEIPYNGATSQYNDLSLGHLFQWSGSSGGKIRFSREIIADCSQLVITFGSTQYL